VAENVSDPRFRDVVGVLGSAGHKAITYAGCAEQQNREHTSITQVLSEHTTPAF
jgi:hypothetical protein